jgi:hypothetical protein
MFVLGLMALLLSVFAACSRQPEGEPSPAAETPAPSATAAATAAEEPTPSPGATVAPSDTPAPPISQADLDSALETVRDFLGKLSIGEYRDAYGSQLTTAGQERLAELVLGRLALSNPHISFFELLGAEPRGDRIGVDVVWRETHDEQGEVGAQEARLLLARQGGGFLVDDIELGAFEPAATPIPPSLPNAEVLTAPAVAGQEMRFRASGFQGGETLVTWLELPDGVMINPVFGASDEQGVFEATFAGDETSGQTAGQWIWWAQALRDSTRNAGITFAVEAAPEPTATPTPAPTRAPTPTPRPAVVVQPTQSQATQAPPTATAAPSTAYAAPVLLWPEPLTAREYNSALVVEFIPAAPELAADEYYQLQVTAANQQGVIYNGGSVQGKGSACSGVYSTPCLSLTADERFMRPFHPDGPEARGEWRVVVVKETAPGQFTPVSPTSETRVVRLMPQP